jgi:hypothetical protein
MIKICIICSIHGEFWQIANDHLSGYGCPKCNTSKGEQLIIKYLEDAQIEYKIQIKFLDCRDKNSLAFDFGIYQNDKLVGLIEFNGKQHYEAVSFGSKTKSAKKLFDNVQRHDRIKYKFCQINNIPLLVIPYTEKDLIAERINSFYHKYKQDT